MSNSEMEYNIVGDLGAVETGNLFLTFRFATTLFICSKENV